MCGGSENGVIISIIMKAVGFLILQEPALPLQGQGLNCSGSPGLRG